MFDLFNLHDQKEDLKPNRHNVTSLICVKGIGLSTSVRKTIEDLARIRAIRKIDIFREISREIGLADVTLKRKVNEADTEWLPLVFLETLFNKWSEYSGFSQKEYTKNKERIIKLFEWLKVNNPSSKPVKAVTVPTEDLCKISGAHAADGCLHKAVYKNHTFHYIISICDGDIKNICLYSKWLSKTFGIELSQPKQIGNAFYFAFRNKILFRYLNNILNFPSGRKSRIVKEPEIIVKSPFKFRKAFAKGVMMFDCSVTAAGNIRLGIKSQSLRNSVAEILQKDNLKINQSDFKSGVFNLFTSTRLGKSQLTKWLDYFETNTEKYFRIYELIHGFQKKPNNIEEALDVFRKVFPFGNKSKVSIADILESMIELRKAYVWEIRDYLLENKNLESLSYTPIKFNMFLLEKLGKIVKSSQVPVRFKKSGHFCSLYELNPIEEWNIPLRGN